MKKSICYSRFLWSLLGFLLVSRAAAQEPDLFFEQIDPWPIYEMGYSHDPQYPLSLVLEVPPEGDADGYYLMAVSENLSIADWMETLPLPQVLKLSEKGELIDALSLGFESRHNVVTGVYRVLDDPGCFVAVGRVYHPELQYDKPFMARFDCELNLLWQREIELPESCHKYFWPYSMMDSEGNIVCAYSNTSPNNGGVDEYAFCFRLTPEGELDGLFEFPSHFYAFELFEYPDGSGDYGYFGEVDVSATSDHCVLWRINHDMDSASQRELPDKYWKDDPSGLFQSWIFNLINMPLPTIIPLPDNSLILASEAHYCRQDWDNGATYGYGMGFLLVDRNGEAVAGVMDEQSVNDSINYRGMCKQSTSPLLDDDTFYFVYSVGAPHGTGYDHLNCFVVDKVDVGGKVVWRRYWNRYYPEFGMKVYCPQSYVPTHDNGCLVTGYSYPSDINAPGTVEYENDVFLIKFFADGSLSSTEAEAFIRPYAFFPNPAGEVLCLEYSPDVSPAKVELYDLQGRLVLCRESGLESIAMGNLPTGVYTLRVTLGDGKTYADTVIKK